MTVNMRFVKLQAMVAAAGLLVNPSSAAAIVLAEGKAEEFVSFDFKLPSLQDGDNYRLKLETDHPFAFLLDFNYLVDFYTSDCPGPEQPRPTCNPNNSIIYFQPSRVSESTADLVVKLPRLGEIGQNFYFINFVDLGGKVNLFVGPDIAFKYRLSADAVPEPATWALMLGGFGLVGATSRRRTLAKVTYA